MHQYDEPYLYCNSCVASTRHFVFAVHAWPDADTEEPENEYDLLHCGTCRVPKLRWSRNEPGERFEKYFPPLDVHRMQPWATHLPPQIHSMLRETYRALNEGFAWLSAMGLRALIDQFATEAVGDVGGFKAKVAKLQASGYLSEGDVTALTVAIELGHDATHRSRCPELENCVHALRIVEHLLQRFAIQKDAQALQSRLKIPARPKCI